MGLLVCPTDVVAAAPDRIWSLLTQREQLSRWLGVLWLEGPERVLAAGDQVTFGKGPFRFGWRVLAAEAPRRFTVDVALPWGVVNHEVVELSSAGPGKTRVTFN